MSTVASSTVVLPVGKTGSRMIWLQALAADGGSQSVTAIAESGKQSGGLSARVARFRIDD